jgi:hypothetical protein
VPQRIKSVSLLAARQSMRRAAFLLLPVAIRGFPPSPYGEFGFFRRVEVCSVIPLRNTPLAKMKSNANAMVKNSHTRQRVGQIMLSRRPGSDSSDTPAVINGTSYGFLVATTQGALSNNFEPPWPTQAESIPSRGTWCCPS